MKTLIIATLLFLPCLLIVSESNTIIPNLIGFAYIGILALFANTRAGMYFIIKLLRKISSINDIIFKGW